MNSEKYYNSVKNIMINKNPYGHYHKKNFDSFNDYGGMAPINSQIINDMPSSQILLSEDVYEALLATQDVTNETLKEIPFFLYGQEIGSNSIEFTEYISASTNRENTSATFNTEMINNLSNKINGSLNNGLVVSHGHSHPPIGDYNENFSLGDFASYMYMNLENPVFKNRQVELTGCLLTPSGDINFVFYDNINQNFYRFTNVFVRDKNNNLNPVNCYGLNQNRQQENGFMR